MTKIWNQFEKMKIINTLHVFIFSIMTQHLSFFKYVSCAKSVLVILIIQVRYKIYTMSYMKMTIFSHLEHHQNSK